MAVDDEIGSFIYKIHDYIHGVIYMPRFKIQSTTILALALYNGPGSSDLETILH